jgi:hypothetical protein
MLNRMTNLVNSVRLIGNVGRTPEVKEFGTGRKKAADWPLKASLPTGNTPAQMGKNVTSPKLWYMRSHSSTDVNPMDKLKAPIQILQQPKNQIKPRINFRFRTLACCVFMGPAA